MVDNRNHYVGQHAEHLFMGAREQITTTHLPDSLSSLILNGCLSPVTESISNNYIYIARPTADYLVALSLWHHSNFLLAIVLLVTC